MCLLPLPDSTPAAARSGHRDAGLPSNAGHRRRPLLSPLTSALSLSHGFGWDFARARRLQFARHRHFSGCLHPSPSSSLARSLARLAGTGLGFWGEGGSGSRERVRGMKKKEQRRGSGGLGLERNPPLLCFFSFFFIF